MSKTTIEWTQETWNPTTGCTKVSKECLNCYAEINTQYNNSVGIDKYKLGFENFVEHPFELNKPFKINKPSLIFVNSMSDLFHEKSSLEFIKKVFDVMNKTPQHTYQILTKRHHQLEKYSDQLNWTENIWMGVSVGNLTGVRRIEKLRNCGAKNKFLSVEPLIEELPNLDLTGIDWVIVGGESGKNARFLDKSWIDKIRIDCENQNVPFFFKQWGKLANNPNYYDPTARPNHTFTSKGGCMLDGKIYRENPCKVNSFVRELF